MANIVEVDNFRGGLLFLRHQVGPRTR